MNDDSDRRLVILRELITETIEACKDEDLLDLVYKLLLQG